MLKSYKTEINPTQDQKQKINKTIGTCRFLFNFYLAYNKEIYKQEQRFISGMDFSKWLNNKFIPNNSEYSWIKEVSSKSTKQSIMNAEKAYKRFFQKQSQFPKFKKKNKSDVKMYFVKTDDKSTIQCDRHRIKIPTLGWIRLKEKGHIPTNKTIKSGTVSYKAGRYYVSVLVEEPDQPNPQLNNFGIGIDLGIKDFAVCSNGNTYKNINKMQIIKQLDKKLKREQRKLSRKYENLKTSSKKMKGEATRQNIQKQVLKVQKLYQRLDSIRTNYNNQVVNELVKTKPSYITIEDLNVKGMMRNKHLSRTVAQQNFYSFKIKLETKCREIGIELRVVYRWYPSSQRCHECGQIKSNLKLSDRVYSCDCGYVEDRDYNASLNLRDAEIYRVA